LNNFCARATSLTSVEKQTSSKMSNLNNLRRSGDCYIYTDTERVSSSTHCPLLCRGTKPRIQATITYCSNYQLWLHTVASVNHLQAMGKEKIELYMWPMTAHATKVHNRVKIRAPCASRFTHR
jgi:hypothetical protein